MELSSETLPLVTDTVAALGVPSHGLWRNIFKCASEFLVAESISKETTHIYVPKRWNRFFAIYVVRLALYVCLKNICDGVGSQNGSNGTPLDPPLFWLDNIFKIPSGFSLTIRSKIKSRDRQRWLKRFHLQGPGLYYLFIYLFVVFSLRR